MNRHNKEETCYLCGTSENLTSEHVIPKVLFPKPRPDDMLTTKACRKCNNDLGKDDELFAVWVSAAMARSDAAVWVWDNKVTNGILKRSPKLATKLVSDSKKAEILTEYGIAEVDVLSIDQSRLERVLFRTVKGLTRILVPDLDYSNHKFTAERMWPCSETEQMIREHASKMQYLERGKSVFRCLYGVTSDPERNVAFLLIYYDSIGFWVFGVNDKKLTQENE